MDLAQFERTRFLAQLDDMLMQDTQGALDDMIQVLRESGRLQTAQSQDRYDRRFRQERGFDEHVKCRVAMRLADHLFYERAIKFSEEQIDPMTNRITAKIEVLVSGA